MTPYTNATIPTPGVTCSYDPIYPRVLTMVDGIGTTTYAYKAPGVLGAGQGASVDGPLTNDTSPTPTIHWAASRASRTGWGRLPTPTTASRAD